ncbi:nitrite reductase large subunit NirB [Listeria aquatica]|uniref:nitrite reductase large subunit NirB n=1 Tax=Listeria aquatica TaxID=1494960 RepID=UPI003EF158D2
MEKEKLVLIGNGMAGVRTIEEILEREPERYQITIIGEEKYPNYNRIMLSNILQKKTTVEEIITNPFDWYQEMGIELFVDNRATHLNPKKKEIELLHGEKISYDICILATGSRAFILPISGADLDGVVAFRTIEDTEKIMAAASTYRKAAVIGGGLLGLEAAKGLVDQGMNVTVVHLENWLMETQLNEKAGKLLKEDLEKQGLKFKMGAKTEKILGEKRVTGLSFADGSELEADLVVMSIGIRPETSLAKEAELEVGRGICVNDYLATSDSSIFAIGECVEHRGVCYGLVAPLYEQAKVLADSLTGRETDGYHGSMTYTALKVSGCDLFSAGCIKAGDDIKTIEAYDEWNHCYKKVFIQNNQVVGTILYGDTTEENRFLKLITQKLDISELNPIALLAAANGEDEALNDVTNWDDFETVCGCNGVTKGTIMQAIADKNLTSVADVTKHTKAGGSCGKCKDKIADLLSYALGEEAPTTSKGICGCTDLTRDEIVLKIHQKGLKSVSEVYQELHFKNPEGCSKCRPAINFYLNVAFPQEHQDEKASRYVNERLYANIQNDGTYSVIPRMRGGKTDPQQLLLIAKAAEKYDVPLVKITGSQRIGLYGVKKQDLPKIWKDLDMSAAEAYAKAVRSVKTCVGKNFCRFGTQDSMGLGIQLEERYEFIDTPHKFKMGVSACPRSCAESCVKDFGVIGVENGFQIYIGGNGGTTVQESRFLTTVETEEEVIDICGAFLEYYRETGIYAERTAPWIDRLGFEHVKQILLDEAERAKLLSELEKAGKREEPWHQTIQDTELQQKLYTVGSGEQK